MVMPLQFFHQLVAMEYVYYENGSSGTTAAFKGPSRLFEPRANAVILRSERAFISAFTRVFNALWRASLEGGRAPPYRKGTIGTASTVHPSRLACSQVAACSHLRTTDGLCRPYDSTQSRNALPLSIPLRTLRGTAAKPLRGSQARSA